MPWNPELLLKFTFELALFVVYKVELLDLWDNNSFVVVIGATVLLGGDSRLLLCIGGVWTGF